MEYLLSIDSKEDHRIKEDNVVLSGQNNRIGNCSANFDDLPSAPTSSADQEKERSANTNELLVLTSHSNSSVTVARDITSHSAISVNDSFLSRQCIEPPSHPSHAFDSPKTSKLRKRHQ